MNCPHPSLSEAPRLSLSTRLSLALAFLLAGCHTPHVQKLVLGPDYQPSNIFRQCDALPAELRRVAVLPLVTDSSQVEVVAGREALEPVLRTELLKAKKFEVVWVTPEALRHSTGRTAWSSQDKLPPDLFARLRDLTGCDGVLLCQLSRYHAYPPIIIGWNLKLINASNAQILWAADEIFDGAEPLVSNAARRYELKHDKSGPTTDSPMILTSPRNFGHYTLWALLNTLPAR